MATRENTVCFTGHRHIQNEKKLRYDLYHAVETLILGGFCNFLTGGARGFDTLAAETVLQLKERSPNVQLTVVCPYAKPYLHEKDWSRDDIRHYDSSLKHADAVMFLTQAYHQGCYYERDRYLVDHASICVAYQTQKSGGTAYTTHYAATQHVKIMNLAVC